MNIRALCRDGETTKPKQCWVPSSTGDRAGFHLLSSGSTGAPGRTGVIYGNRDFSKDAGKTAMLMDTK